MMALFGFGKKKETGNKPACACHCGCPTAQADEATLTQNRPSGSGGHTIKVLGTGCASCHALLENTQAAVAHMNLNAQVEYVQDMAQIAGYGVMSVPALVVDETVVSMGKVLKSSEVEAMLRKIFN